MEEQQSETGWKVYLMQFRSFIVECQRVLAVTKKPSGEEFKTVVKVAGMGILFIGLVGFIIMTIALLIKGL